jgi:hypothetical protein
VLHVRTLHHTPTLSIDALVVEHIAKERHLHHVGDGPLMTCLLPGSVHLQALEKLVNEWEGAELMVIAYRETGTFVVKVEEALSQGLDDAIVMLQSMQFSPYKKPFEEKLAKWDAQLNLVGVRFGCTGLGSSGVRLLFVTDNTLAKC